MRSLSFALGVVLLSACGASERVSAPTCPDISIAAVELTVIDGASGLADASGVTAIAREGAYADTLRTSMSSSGRPVQLHGVWDRPGQYIVTVTRAGYTTVTTSVAVPRGTCGPVRQQVVVWLFPGA